MRAWFYTIFGPLLAGASGFLPGAGIITAVKVTLGVCLMASVSWGSVSLTNWWHSDKLTIAQSDQRCADATRLATVEAKERAIISREHTVREREESLATQEEGLKGLMATMERDREEARRAGADGIIVPADDEWLRRYQARHARTGRR